MIEVASRVGIVSHVTPDPDAIGSLLGLGNALRGMGKQVLLLCDDPVPRGLHFLPGSNDILASLPSDWQVDLAIGVDASDPERLGKAWAAMVLADVPTLNIDHHITNLSFARVNVVNSEWASTAEGLVEVIDALKLPLSGDVAVCLLTGVIGDTRSFSTSSTTPAALRVAARLMDAGADIAATTEHVFSRRSLATLRLWGLGLSKLHRDGGVLWTAMTMEERRALGVDDSVGSGLSNLMISAEEANISAVFIEQPDGTIDSSFRARPGYDVASVALSLGGGGHALAAGAKLAGPIDQVVAQAVSLLRQAAQLPVE